jgi:hypothetical protein
VLDSTPIYDAVATMDTVTLVRSAIRGLLAAADEHLEAELRAVLGRDDDYATPGKPACDWDDPTAREALVDALATDALACLALLEGRRLPGEVGQAAALVGAVVGQDLERGQDGVFRIARKVAGDRIISTVDPDARHGHKTGARGFDGYKGHLAADPDAEIITATAVSAAGAGDATVAEGLLADCLPGKAALAAEEPDRSVAGSGGPHQELEVAVYGDAAYGTGALLATLEQADARPMVKVQAPTPPAGTSPRTASPSTLTPGRSPARVRSPSACAPPPMAAAKPGSGGRVRPARWPPAAPPPAPAG